MPKNGPKILSNRGAEAAQGRTMMSIPGFDDLLNLIEPNK